MSDIRESELFSAYLDGEVTAAEQARVEQLLASDPAARRLMDSLEALRARLQSLPAEKLGTDLSQRVLRAAERRMLVGEDPRPAPAAPPQRPWWREIHWRGMLSRRALMWSGLAVAIALMLKLNDTEHPRGQADRAVARAPQPAAEESAPRKHDAAAGERPAAPPPEIHAPAASGAGSITKTPAEKDDKLTLDGGTVMMGGIASPAARRASGGVNATDDSRRIAQAPPADNDAPVLEVETGQRPPALAQLELKKAPEAAKEIGGVLNLDAAKGLPKSTPAATDLAADGQFDSFSSKDLKDAFKQGAGAPSPSNKPTDRGGDSGKKVAGIAGTGGGMGDQGPGAAAPSPGSGPVGGTAVAGAAPMAERPVGQSLAGPAEAPPPPATPQAPARAPAEQRLRETPKGAPAGAAVELADELDPSSKEAKRDRARPEADAAMVVECDVRPDVLKSGAFERLLARNGLGFRKDPADKEVPQPAPESRAVYRVDATPAQVGLVLAQLAQDPKTFYRFAVKPPSRGVDRRLADLERARKPQAAAEPAAPAGRRAEPLEEKPRTAERLYPTEQAEARSAEKPPAAPRDEGQKAPGDKASAPAYTVVFVLRVVDQRPAAAAAAPKSDAKAAAPAKPAGKAAGK
jgi:negative regulator of sigma E activity